MPRSRSSYVGGRLLFNFYHHYFITMKSIMKTSIVLFALMALLFCAPTVQAQLHVASDGDVGIGTTSPTAKLDVRTTGTNYSIYMNNSYSGSSTKYGMYNYVSSAGTGSNFGIFNNVRSGTSGTHYGIHNFGAISTSSTAYNFRNYMSASGGNGARYGIYNYLTCSSGGGTGTKYALYSSVASGCSGTKYAGYFNGNVYVSGTITSTSDAAKKTNINELTGAMSLISQLKPKTYNFKADPDLVLPSEKQFGFLAQEIEGVLPELVKTVETVGNKAVEIDGEMQTEPVATGEIKTVNYIGMIPVLVQGMQEQQALIEAQAKRIEELEAKINK